MSAVEFNLASEALDEGAPEERATFGILTIKAAGQSLTEGFDHYLDGFRSGPLVSAYYLAEWLAWNWWRLRWEAQARSLDWNMAHQMNTIGEGYVWPNIEIWSDGLRSVLISHASSTPDAKPFRYVGATPVVVPSSSFERAVDEFMPRIIGRLRDSGVGETNLDRLWKDVLEERRNPEVAERRRLEALMGRDPDAVGDNAVEELLASKDRLGAAAVDEVAADLALHGNDRRVMRTARDFEEVAKEAGFVASPRDSLKLRAPEVLPKPAHVPAWRLGATAAHLVREQERLDDIPLSDERLAAMIGTDASVLTDSRGSAPFSFSLDSRTGAKSSIVLPTHRKENRRFALARILGDKLMNRSGSLRPATRAYTYRQKAQRSFAAELLAPFDAVEERMAGDFSEDSQQDVAEHFSVSTMVINTLLKNHGRIERDDVEEVARTIAS